MTHWTAQHTGSSGGRIRTERVRGAIRQEIADMLLRQEIHDPRLTGFVSITDVQLSRDLQHATVYFSAVEGDATGLAAVSPAVPPPGDVLPAGAGRDRVDLCQQVLTHAAGFIRSQLGRRLSLRHVPHLRFLPDHSLDDGMRMDRLLGSLHIPPADEEGDASPGPAGGADR
ncbi:MAG: ribosome-binding factor A [Magnetococcus sp. DMHC-8]